MENEEITAFIGLFSDYLQKDYANYEIKSPEYMRLEVKLIKKDGFWENSNRLEWPQARERSGWGLIRGFGIFDENGELLHSGAVFPAVRVGMDERCVLEIGYLQLGRTGLDD